MIKRYGSFLLILFFVFLIPSCGKSLFAPLSSSTIPRDPLIALDRAEYLYLSGEVEKADAFYTQLMAKYASNPASKEIYYESLRGHAKCLVEKDTTDGSDVFSQFFEFISSIDFETFSVDEEQLAAFKEDGAQYSDKLYLAFNTLALIPDADRTEGDYANMSIAGVFSVLFQAVDFFQEASQTQETVLAEFEKINEKREEFEEKWEELEQLQSGTPSLQQLQQTQSDLKTLAQDINTIYTEIKSTLTEIVSMMETVQAKSTAVKEETAAAENPISVMLNMVFEEIDTVISDALPTVEELDEKSGEFYSDLQTALDY